VAIRAGTALRLGQDLQREGISLELELRRRLWYCIALMDTHGSYDRGTPPILRWDDLGPAPLLLNDEEMSRDVIPISSKPGFNDMSFFALMFRAMVCQKKMMSMPDSTDDRWAARLQLVFSFEKSIRQDYCNVNKDAQPFERFTEQVAKGIITSMHLILRRPPYKQYPGLVPSSDDFDVLEHSITLLRQDLASKSKEFAPWAWKSWVRWNALAIVLVELCSQSPEERYDDAYSIAIQSFNHYSSAIADAERGMLWKPISKLMRRLLQLKHYNHVSEQASSLASGFEVDTPMCSTILDLSMPDLGFSFDKYDENGYIPQEDHIITTSGDAQSNWFTFTDSINMGYSVDWEHHLF
jgi:hypothetical protein